MNYLKKADDTIAKIKELLETREVKPEGINIFQAIIYNLAVMRTKITTWIESGEKTFVLTKDLVEAFTHTDIPWSLTPSNFHYPFECFMVESYESLFQTKFEGYDPRSVQGILFLDNQMILRNSKIKWIGDNGVEKSKPDWDIS